jgi:chromosome segregation ATPase
MSTDTIGTAATETESAAERVQRGRRRLAEFAVKIKEAQAGVEAVASQQKALDDTVSARERAVAEAEAAVGEAEQAVIRLRAQELLAMHTLDPLERKQAEQALKRAELAVEEAKEQHASAERVRSKETTFLADKQRLAARNVADLERLWQMLHAAVQAAQAEAGQDRQAELRQRHGELLAERNAALDAYQAKSAELREFYGSLEDELSAWPDLARLPRDEQVGHPLTPAREVIETFLLYVTSLEANAGTKLPAFNDASLVGLLSTLDEDVLRDTFFAAGRGYTGTFIDMRRHAARILAKLG